MDTLHAILSELDGRQLLHVRAYIRGFPCGKAAAGGREARRSVELFDAVRGHRSTLSDDEYSRMLYGKAGDVRFVSLKRWLKNRVCDAMLADVNLDREDDDDARLMARIRAKKKLSLLYLLTGKGGKTGAIGKLFRELEALCKKFELFDEWVECLHTMKYYQGYRQGQEKLESYGKELLFYQKCNNLAYKALDSYYKYSLRVLFEKEGDTTEREHLLYKAITELREESSDVKSIMAEYYLKRLEVDYSRILDDYDLAKQTCLETLKLLKSSKAVYRRDRFGMAYGDLSACETMTGNYTKAVMYARMSQRYFAERSANMMASKTHEFYALFHAGRYEDAAKAVDYLRACPREERGDFVSSTYDYYMACVHFMQGEFEAALGLLLKNTPALRDRAGWSVGIRRLTVFCLIELGQAGQAALHIGATGKGLRRAALEGLPVRERDMAIQRIMEALQRRDFHFAGLGARQIAEAGRLLSEERPWRWKPDGHELIPFHRWLAGKAGITPQKQAPARRSSRDKADVAKG